MTISSSRFSNTPELLLTLDPAPADGRFRYLLAALWLLAAVVVYQAGYPLSAVALAVCVLTLACFAGALAPRGPDRWRLGGAGCAHRVKGGWRPVRLIRSPIVLPFLVVAQFEQGRRQVALRVFRDGVSEREWRLLRAHLRLCSVQPR